MGDLDDTCVYARAQTRDIPSHPAMMLDGIVHRLGFNAPSKKMLDAPSPDLAIGMVSSLGRAAQRDRVRETVFDSPMASRVAWRFLVGNNSRIREDAVPDVLRYSTDGGSSSKHCSCSEKTRFWFQYALRRWPSVSWIAKTEDDTYLHLGKLLADLAAPRMEPGRAAGEGRVMYGLMNLCTATPYSHSTKGCFLGDMETQQTVCTQYVRSRVLK